MIELRFDLADQIRNSPLEPQIGEVFSNVRAIFRMCRFFEYHDFLRISGQPRFCWMCIFSLNLIFFQNSSVAPTFSDESFFLEYHGFLELLGTQEFSDVRSSF